MKRKLTIWITDELYERIKTNAKNCSMTISSFICSELASLFLKDVEILSPVRASSNDRITIILRGNDATLLRKRAGKLGISPTAFVRDAVVNKSMTLITIDREGETLLANAIEKYEQSLNEIVGSLYATEEDNHSKDILPSIESNLSSLVSMVEKYCNYSSRIKDSRVRQLTEEIHGD